MSSLLASPTTRRHHLSPIKPSRISRKTCGVEARNTACVTSKTRAPKRSADENGHIPSSPTKRAKSLSVAKTKRAFGALLDITNIRSSVKKNEKCGPGVLEKKAKPSPPSSPKKAFRGLKRAYSPPRFKRIDPPTTTIPRSPKSINHLLASLKKPEISSTPESWKFDIYEDSPEEMLQNLMEHSTHTLDISDDSDNDSELCEKGKENIPPERLQEILSVAPAHRMLVDFEPRRLGRLNLHRREALREMRKEELELEMKIPTLKNESFFEFKTPKKAEKVEKVESPPSPGFVIWESDHEKEASEDEADEDEVSRAAKVPLPPSELDFELEPGFEVDADSLYGGSDREL